MSTRFTLRAIPFVILSVLSACGGGGGNDASTGTTGETSPPTVAPPVNAFSATASVSKAEPMQRVALSLASAADSAANYTVEVDVSGLGTFAASTTLTLPGWVEDGKIVMAAPVLEMARQSATDATATSFAVRVRRGADAALTPAITIAYDPLVIPAAQRGRPSTLLKLAFKALFAESGGVLQTRAAQLKPGTLADATALLGGDMAVADIQAEAILRQVFSFTTLDRPLTAQADRSFSLTARVASGTDDVKSGFDSMWTCVGNLMSQVEGSYGDRVEHDCMSVARQAVRDKIIPGISGLQSKVATVAGMAASLAGVSRGFLGGYVERLIASATRTEFVVDLAQMALTSPDLGATPSETADFLGGKLTEKAKKLLYSTLTRDLTPVGEGALALVDAEDAMGGVIDLAGEKLGALHRLSDSLTGLADDSDRMQALSEEFGGPAATAPDQLALGPLGTVKAGDTPMTAASVCAQNPGFDAAAQGAGFASCVALMQPYFDPVYMKTTLMPLQDKLLGFDFNALSACVSAGSSASCDALIAQATALTDNLMAALHAYASKDYACDAGYATYANRSGGSTCVHASLAYEPNGACYAGSNAAGFDVGGANVCVYYSRDYLQADGSCRTNYTKANFEGRQTCRWSALPAASPAAYAINPDSGDRVTLVR